MWPKWHLIDDFPWEIDGIYEEPALESKSHVWSDIQRDHLLKESSLGQGMQKFMIQRNHM